MVWGPQVAGRAKRAALATVLALSILLGFDGAPANAQTSGPDAAALISSVGALNRECRGVSGPNTQRSCDQRERVYEALRQKGWCWGRPEQAEYQKWWTPCGGGRSAALLLYENDLIPLQRAFAVAYVASLCRLRSEGYLRTFYEIRQSAFEAEQARGRLSQEEWARASDNLNTIYQAAERETGFRRADANTLTATCASLPTDPNLRKLDDAYQKIIAGRR